MRRRQRSERGHLGSLCFAASRLITSYIVSDAPSQHCRGCRSIRGGEGLIEPLYDFEGDGVAYGERMQYHSLAFASHPLPEPLPYALTDTRHLLGSGKSLNELWPFQDASPDFSNASAEPA